MQINTQGTTTQLRLPPTDGTEISIVIVSYNTKALTLACVQSVYDTAGDLKVQIIVVDNCSADGSAEAVRAAYPTALVIDSPANGGFAYGNNIGFEQARGRAILCLNPDTRLHPGALQAAYARLFAEPTTGMVGSKTLWEANGEQQSTLFRYLGLRHFTILIVLPALWLRMIPFLGDLRYAARDRNKVQDVEAVAGCFMLVRRAVLENQGGMDQRFFMYGEESEWCHRLTTAGWHILYEPQAVITHHGAASTGAISPWKAVEMAKGHMLFLRFTRGAGVSFAGTVLLLLHDLFGAPYYLARWAFRLGKPDVKVATWSARIKFIASSLIKPPRGQTIARPAPETVVP